MRSERRRAGRNSIVDGLEEDGGIEHTARCLNMSVCVYGRPFVRCSAPSEFIINPSHPQKLLPIHPISHLYSSDPSDLCRTLWRETI